ncbi:MAG TPA: U32 family peptidase [Fibrobacteria bacterium]|nr:U32 family peptidase [Fibrobacteria bacterium]HOX50014.1 U32 family peptidase [Fibrobacteria bacterium]
MSLPTPVRIRIVAPLHRPEEVPDLARAGADEIYCGYLPPDWISRYGDWDGLSRRQGTVANLSFPDQLRRTARACAELGMGSALALNVRFTEAQIPSVLDIALLWESAGGTSVVVSCPNLLLALDRSGSRLQRHLSLLANCANSAAIRLFLPLGVSRFVLPRELTIAEMARIAAVEPGLEYEAMSYHDKCTFVDGLCGFYHDTVQAVETDLPADFDASDPSLPCVERIDPGYEGHGCGIAFASSQGAPFTFGTRSSTPGCAVCDVAALADAGVTFLKIGGRGLPLAEKIRAIRRLRDAADRRESSTAGRAAPIPPQDPSRKGCREGRCYYGTDR